MKICIIGNSHIAALKLAWTEMSDTRHQDDIVFFGHRGTKIADLAAQDGVLAPENQRLRKAMRFTSGGLAVIDPKAYDIILVHGVGVEAFFLPEDRFFTRKFRHAAVHDVVDKAPALKIIRLLRSLSDIPIFVGHMPLPVATDISGDQSTSAFVNGMNFAQQEIFSALNAKLVLQPLETIVNGQNTDRRFKDNSTSLAIGDAWDNQPHRDGDRRHMNKDFGKLWLSCFFELI